MKKALVLILIAIFVSGLALPAMAEEPAVQTSGRIIQVKLTGTLAPGQTITFELTDVSAASTQTSDEDKDDEDVSEEDVSEEDATEDESSHEAESDEADEADDESGDEDSDEESDETEGSEEDEADEDSDREEDSDEEILEENAEDAEDILELEGDDLAQAVEAALRILESNPEDPIALAIVARGESAAGNYDRALELAQQLKAADPDNPLAVALEADALIGQGKLDEALALLQNSPAINDDDDLLEALAEIHEKKGDLDEAVDALEKALAVAEERQTEVYGKLKDVFKKLGDKGLKIYVEGKKPTFDVEPQVIDGRTMVPFRALAEALDATVAWDPVSSAVAITKGDSVVKLAIGSTQAEVNGVTVLLAIPVQVIDGRIMVPLRFVGEALSAEVLFDPETGMIIIKQAPPAIAPAPDQTAPTETAPAPAPDQTAPAQPALIPAPNETAPTQPAPRIISPQNQNQSVFLPMS